MWSHVVCLFSSTPSADRATQGEQVRGGGGERGEGGAEEDQERGEEDREGVRGVCVCVCVRTRCWGLLRHVVVLFCCRCVSY